MTTQTILFIGYEWQLQMPLTNTEAYHIVCKQNYDDWDDIQPDFLIDGTKQWQHNITNIEDKQIASCLHAPDCLLETMPKKSVRFIAWNSFFQRTIWEFSGILDTENKIMLESIFQKQLIAVPDDIGLISGQIVCGIINEAFLTYEEGTSEQQDIDIAMKLGTNYPYGPFEWYELIGSMEVKQVLAQKAILDIAYKPANMLLI